MTDADILFGCDVGGTRIKLGVVHGGSLLARSEIPAQAGQGLQGALRRIAPECELLRRAAGVASAAISGFALAFPGIIDPDTGRILSTPAGKFDDASKVDAQVEVRRLLGLRAFIVNDANAALAGEWQFGAARGCRSVVMMTLGTGIGSSAILEGVPVRGAHGQAGCLGGHVTANMHGPVCRCGNLGCAETEASTWALPERARAHWGFAMSLLAREDVLDYRAVFRCAAQGDPLAVELRDQAWRVWGSAVVTLIHAYDPVRVVIGGGILEGGAGTLEAIREHVRRHAWTPWGKVEIVPAARGNDAGLLGAAWLAGQTFAAKNLP